MDTYIFGIHPLIEAIEAGKDPEKVLFQKGLQGENFSRLFQLVRKQRIPFQMVPAERLNRITRKNHQGVIAYMALIDYQPLHEVIQMAFDSGEIPLLVVLDGITDIRNFGALVRSAECAGAHAVIMAEKGSAQVNADAIKASAGALTRMPVCREAKLPSSVTFMKECGIQVVVLDEKARKTIYQADFGKPTAIVMGSEEKGVSKLIRSLADESVNIPMKGKIASLNVSVAAGIVLFEALRQRKFIPKPGNKE